MKQETTPTTAVIIQQEHKALKHYRRALTKPYQRAYDELWVFASYYQMPCTCADFPLPFYFCLLSILLQQQKILNQLQSSFPHPLPK